MIKTENITQENKIIDDVSDVNQETLQQLKEKLAKKKEKDMTINIVAPVKRSIKFGVVGTGQAGTRLAEQYYSLGYPAVAFNTAPQDLEHIRMPEENKYLLEYSLGGAAKDLEIGREAAEQHKEAIYSLVAEKLEEAQVFILCTSLGGGSGAGSLPVMVDVLAALGKPIVVMAVLPMSSEDAQTKKNALETLSSLSKEAQAKRIHNLVVVDNAKIETIYSDVSPMEFFNVSNKAIISPINAFNELSSLPSSMKPLDPMEFTKLLIDGSGCSVYGEVIVSDFQDETAISEAIINVNSGLLASGFDIKQAKYVGVIIEANKSVWDKIPSSSLNYANSLILELCDVPTGIFRGTYATDLKDNVVKVYSMFSGLGLPESRVSQLKKETQEFASKVKTKDAERTVNLKLDTGTDDTVSAADKVRQKIAAKKSAFGSMIGSIAQDKRKK